MTNKSIITLAIKNLLNSQAKYSCLINNKITFNKLIPNNPISKESVLVDVNLIYTGLNPPNLDKLYRYVNEMIYDTEQNKFYTSKEIDSNLLGQYSIDKKLPKYIKIKDIKKSNEKEQFVIDSLYSNIEQYHLNNSFDVELTFKKFVHEYNSLLSALNLRNKTILYKIWDKIVEKQSMCEDGYIPSKTIYIPRNGNAAEKFIKLGAKVYIRKTIPQATIIYKYYERNEDKEGNEINLQNHNGTYYIAFYEDPYVEGSKDNKLVNRQRKYIKNIK